MQHTEKYQLNLIEPSDELSLDPLNENMTKLEAALDGCSRVAFGTYRGNGQQSQKIDLGFTPKAVLIISETGLMGHEGRYFGGLSIAGTVLHTNSVVATIEEGGFLVYYGMNGSAYTNTSGSYYYYIAFR